MAFTIVKQARDEITNVTASTFADRLVQARTAANLSQAELAKAAGLKSSGSVGNWEKGTRKQPRNILGLAKALKVRAEWLKDGREPMKPDPATENLDLETALRFLASQLSSIDDLPPEIVKAGMNLLVDGRADATKTEKAIRTILTALDEEPSSKKSQGEAGASRLGTGTH